MAFELPKDWIKDNPNLYIYKDGTRITKTTYNSKEGWFLMPVDLDETVTEFEATNEGRDSAFEHFAVAAAAAKPKRKSRAKPKKKAAKKKKKKADPDGDGEDDDDDDDIDTGDDD